VVEVGRIQHLTMVLILGMVVNVPGKNQRPTLTDCLQVHLTQLPAHDYDVGGDGGNDD